MIAVEVLPDILKLKPLIHSSFMYDEQRWDKLDSNLKSLVFTYLNKKISRQNVISSFQQYFNGQIELEQPFVLTMIWGFADRGYGCYRTNKYYTSENMQKMQLAFCSLKNHDLKAAYRILKMIDGLSISYISKLLYFASRALAHDHYCLIFDIRVARALVYLTCPAEIVDIVDIKPSDKFKDYQCYNSLMHTLAQKYAVDAEALEMYLFEL